MKDIKEPIVIFLNGPSSAGKTSLAALLQSKLLPCPFLHIGIDSLIAMMPEQMNNWTGKHVKDGFFWNVAQDENGHRIATIQAGHYAQRISELLNKVVVTFLENGHNVIIDEICVFPGSFARWQNILRPYKTLYVGLTATTKMLEQREKARKDRMLGSARAQNFSIYHENNNYDVMLDTGHLPIDDCAEKILASLPE